MYNAPGMCGSIATIPMVMPDYVTKMITKLLDHNTITELQTKLDNILKECKKNTYQHKDTRHYGAYNPNYDGCTVLEHTTNKTLNNDKQSAENYAIASEIVTLFEHDEYYDILKANYKNRVIVQRFEDVFNECTIYKNTSPDTYIKDILNTHRDKKGCIVHIFDLDTATCNINIELFNYTDGDQPIKLKTFRAKQSHALVI